MYSYIKVETYSKIFNAASTFILKIKDEIKKKSTPHDRILFDVIDMSGTNDLSCKPSSTPQNNTANEIKNK